jgi:hypothetical protein
MQSAERRTSSCGCFVSVVPVPPPWMAIRSVDLLKTPDRIEERKMTRQPKVPLSPSELPQQRILEVRSLPPRPHPFTFCVCSELPAEVHPKQGVPRNPIYLVQVEWAESPMHGGVNAFYLHARKKWWILWRRWFDDGGGWERSRWHWEPAAFCQRRGVSETQAAAHLLTEYLLAEEETVDWINEEGLLKAADMAAILREVGARMEERKDALAASLD